MQMPKAMILAAWLAACSQPQPAAAAKDAAGDAAPVADASGDGDAAADWTKSAETATAADALADGKNPDSSAIADADSSNSDAPSGDSVPPPDAKAEAIPASPCAGQTCSGHGTCYPVYGLPLCKCDPNFYLVGTTQCLGNEVASLCNPNPCSEPDKGICNLPPAGSEAKALCSCAPGFDDIGGVCLFQTCPQVAGRTAITIYDQTGAGVVEGFDPLQEGDTVKIRIDVVGLSGSGTVTVELQQSNLSPDPARWSWDGQKAAVQQKATVWSLQVQLQPGAHALEGYAKLDSALYPLGANARLTGPAGCEIPQSRSGARIGPLGLKDAKGFGCIDLDRTRSVQFTHDVVEKNTAAYAQANGTTPDYQPAGSIVSSVVQCFSRQTDRAVFLAGDGLGLLPWAVDNDVVVEFYDHAPEKGDAPLAAIYTGTDVVSSNKGWNMVAAPKPDVPGTHFGIPNGMPFGYSAGHVRLESLIPKGQSRWIRLVALDQGVVGRLTRVYVLSVPAAEAPRQCLGNQHCVDAKGVISAGCVDGLCSGPPCVNNACAPGLFCVGGLCTSECDQGGGVCPAGTECKTRSCVAVGAADTCVASNKDQDCPKGTVCHWGRCEPGCHHPRKQDQSYAQDPTFCAGNKPALCPHCPDASQGCWNNVCAQCEIDPHCPAGQWCVNRQCAPP